MAKSGNILEGYEEFLRNLKKAPEAAMKEMGKGMDHIVRELANYAKKTGDYTDQTSNLRNTIHGVVTKITRDLIAGEVRAPMEYAAAVEARGRKVISHVIEERWDWIIKTLREHLQTFIDKANRGQL